MGPARTEALEGLVLIGRMTAQPGRRDELIAVPEEGFEVMTPHEPGLLGSTLHTSDEEPDLIVLYEHYASAEAFAEHLANYETIPEYGEFRSRMGALVAGPVDGIQRLTPVSRFQRDVPS